MSDYHDENVKSFICENCGASMEVIEDVFHHRKIVCPACGTSKPIFDSDQSRVTREKANRKIYNMQYARAHPVKYRVQKCWPLFFLLGVGIIVGVLFLVGVKNSLIKINFKIKPPLSSSDVRGMHYEDVKTSFESAGFSNIQTDELGDLVIGLIGDAGDVKEVSINGSTRFSTDDKFEKDAPVIIRYHSYKASDGDGIEGTLPHLDKLREWLPF